MRSESGMRCSEDIARHRRLGIGSAQPQASLASGVVAKPERVAEAIPPDALVRRECVGHCMPWRPPWVRTRTPLALPRVAAPRSSATNWQRCAMKTASALTVVKILVVHSRFPFANFHGAPGLTARQAQQIGRAHV